MHFRKFGKLGYSVSSLGLGCMRLPRMEMTDGSVEVDREKAIELIRYAADNGITYFDSAFTYHNGQSEEVMGEAFDNRRRSTIFLATKQRYPSMQGSKDIMRKNLESSLKKLRTDYLDIYLIHNINANEWEGVKGLKVIEEYEKYKSEGMIRSIGFSFHGNFKLFNEVLNFYDWDMCQVQQNILDNEKEVTEEGIALAGLKKCGLVIMEPLRGGGLAGAPREVMDVYDTSSVKRTPSEWAFRYLIDKPEVSVVLSGMTTLDQLKENIETFSAPDATPHCLTVEDKAILLNAKTAYLSRASIPCTGCEYCMPCPKRVNISGIFSKYNEGFMFDNFNNARRSYMFTKTNNTDVSQCVSCGICVNKCPQSINIPEELKIAHNVLDGWKES